MTQPSSALPANGTDRFLCYYVNATSQLQMARITHLSVQWFDRMIFPGQRLIFEAPLHALLEIYSCKATCTSLLAQIPCQQLRVYEKLASPDRPDAVERL